MWQKRPREKRLVRLELENEIEQNKQWSPSLISIFSTECGKKDVEKFDHRLRYIKFKMRQIRK